MKAWRVEDTASYVGGCTVVFAETRGKAHSIALNTDCCEDAEWCDVRVTRIPDLDRILAQKWKHGGIYIRLTYSQGGYQKLAEYIAKQEGKEYRFSRSRNLIKRDPVKKIMKRGSFNKPPKARKGYTIVQDSIIEMINPLGFPSRQYNMIRILDNRIRGSG